MTQRKIAQYRSQITGNVINVYRKAETEEYVVKHLGDDSEGAGYFTDAIDDALATACAMCGTGWELVKPERKQQRCADCGEPGETTGHQTCQYPRDH